jgi:hypothetical protein
VLLPCPAHRSFLKGLLNKRPADRLGWPDLLEHPFVRETQEERLKREKALADAMELADSSRAWKVGAGPRGLGAQTHCSQWCRCTASAAACDVVCCMKRDVQRLCSRLVSQDAQPVVSVGN